MAIQPPTPLGRAIRNTRKMRYLTLKQLAEKIGVKTTAMQRIEGSSTANPTIYTLQRLAGALGVTVADLVKDVPVIPPEGEEK